MRFLSTRRISYAQATVGHKQIPTDVLNLIREPSPQREFRNALIDGNVELAKSIAAAGGISIGSQIKEAREAAYILLSSAVAKDLREMPHFSEDPSYSRKMSNIDALVHDLQCKATI